MSKGIRSLDGIKPHDLYTKDGSDVWRVVSLCEQPTIRLKNIETEETVGGAVGCLLLSGFQRLVEDQS